MLTTRKAQINRNNLLRRIIEGLQPNLAQNPSSLTNVILSAKEINIGKEKIWNEKMPNYVMEFWEEDENLTLLEKEKSLKSNVLLE